MGRDRPGLLAGSCRGLPTRRDQAAEKSRRLSVGARADRGCGLPLSGSAWQCQPGLPTSAEDRSLCQSQIDFGNAGSSWRAVRRSNLKGIPVELIAQYVCAFGIARSCGYAGLFAIRHVEECDRAAARSDAVEGCRLAIFVVARLPITGFGNNEGGYWHVTGNCQQTHHARFTRTLLD